MCYRLVELFYYCQDQLQDAQGVVQVFGAFVMEAIEVVDSKFEVHSAVQEAFEVALGTTFGKVQVWGRVYRAWDMLTEA